MISVRPYFKSALFTFLCGQMLRINDSFVTFHLFENVFSRFRELDQTGKVRNIHVLALSRTETWL